jgi:hypothetical protein
VLLGGFFFSPDGSDILFLAPLARKRYNGQQELLHKKQLKETETSGVWIKKV